VADKRARGRQLARESIDRGDALGWFEQLYAESEREGTPISWVDLVPNQYLVRWLRRRPQALAGRAIVVGCGYGDDAECLAAAGLRVTAFDIAPTAVARCLARFPGSAVAYEVADALAPPEAWLRAFDFVFEAYTVQVLPGELRARCAGRIGELVAPGGTLLVVARSRRPEDPEGQMPWPLTRTELDGFAVPGLELTRLDEFLEPGDPPVPRFVAEFTARH
jgi:SAM-dependent methyltransferase